MPTVPRATRQIEEGRLPSVRSEGVPEIQPADTRSADRTTQIAENLFQAEKERMDETRLSEERTGFFNNWEYPKIYDPQNGAITRRGKDAIGLTDELKQDFDEYVSKRERQLGNRTQKERFKALAQARWSQVATWASKYEASQAQAYQTAERVASIETSKERATQLPESIPLELTNIRRNLSLEAEEKGWGEDQLFQELQKHETDLHSRVINRHLTSGDGTEARSYFEEVKGNIDPDERRKLLSNIQGVEKDTRASSIAAEAWTKKGPEDDNNPVNTDEMVAWAREQSNDPDVVDTVITDLRERATIHNSSVSDRNRARKDLVWEAFESNIPLRQILASPEFRSLPGTERHDLRETLKKASVELSPEEVKNRKIEQSINYTELAEDPEALRGTDLESLYRNQELSEKDYRSLKKIQSDPTSLPGMQDALERLKRARNKNIFDPDDPAKNDQLWAEYKDRLLEYAEIDAEGDPAEFVNRIMEPVKSIWKEWAKDIFLFGASRTAEARERKARELEAAPVETEPTGKILVVSPDGRNGYIPAEQLDEALEAGYREVR